MNRKTIILGAASMLLGAGILASASATAGLPSGCPVTCQQVYNGCIRDGIDPTYCQDMYNDCVESGGACTSTTGRADRDHAYADRRNAHLTLSH